jgi:8-amino-7-oxononanoate synthase
LQYNDDFLDKKLNERRSSNALRQLKVASGLVDFCSNDYLGIVHHDLLQKHLKHDLKTGSTGSRLLAGNYALIEQTEKKLATFHEAESALIFNSGYDANLGLLASVPQRGDTVLYDYLSHASLRDGIRLSFADAFSFEHNDMTDLEEKLKKAKGNIFIITESVFSMDGDFCPLEELIQLSQKYSAHLIIDEAHATGIIGEKGGGFVQQLSFQSKIFARIHTFGKAVGCHGAVILGSKKLTDYLINFARSFVYSTALPEQSIDVINAAYKVFPSMNEERKMLNELIHLFNRSDLNFEKITSSTAIQAVVIPGNEEVKRVAQKMQKEGFDVRPILYPTIPAGKERIRVVLHAFNTPVQLQQLVSLFNKV